VTKKSKWISPKDAPCDVKLLAWINGLQWPPFKPVSKSRDKRGCTYWRFENESCCRFPQNRISLVTLWRGRRAAVTELIAAASEDIAKKWRLAARDETFAKQIFDKRDALIADANAAGGCALWTQPIPPGATLTDEEKLARQASFDKFNALLALGVLPPPRLAEAAGEEPEAAP
jgi:hypothetical protein